MTQNCVASVTNTIVLRVGPETIESGSDYECPMSHPSKSQTFGLEQTSSMFFINQPYKSIYAHPNICLGLGFEFGPQRIKDLAIMCP